MADTADTAMFMTKEEKEEIFLKACLGGGAAVLVGVLLLSFLQELIKRRIRAKKLRKTCKLRILILSHLVANFAKC
jgi:hypothetical protein